MSHDTVQKNSEQNSSLGGWGAIIGVLIVIALIINGIAAFRTEDGYLNAEECVKNITIETEAMSLLSRVVHSYVCTGFYCCTRKYSWWGMGDKCMKEICFDRSLMDSEMD